MFFFLVVLRFPILANSNQLISADEAIFANQILEIYNGGPFFLTMMCSNLDVNLDTTIKKILLNQ